MFRYLTASTLDLLHLLSVQLEHVCRWSDPFSYADLGDVLRLYEQLCVAAERGRQSFLRIRMLDTMRLAMGQWGEAGGREEGVRRVYNQRRVHVCCVWWCVPLLLFGVHEARVRVFLF